MKKSISKTLSICLLTVLMLFCTIFFTACDNLTSSSQIEKLEKQVQGLQNEKSELRNQIQDLQKELNQYKEKEKALSNNTAISVLLNVQNFAKNPNNYSTQDKEIGSTGMSSYAGIKNWQVNTVDFARLDGSEGNLTSPTLLEEAVSVVLASLNKGFININEDYQKFYYVSEDQNDRSDAQIKIEMTEGEMVIYGIGKLFNKTELWLTQGYRIYVTFTDSYIIQNLVYEGYDSSSSRDNLYVAYYFSNWCYTCEMDGTTTLGKGFMQSIKDEWTKPVKSSDPIDTEKLGE